MNFIVDHSMKLFTRKACSLKDVSCNSEVGSVQIDNHTNVRMVLWKS